MKGIKRVLAVISGTAVASAYAAILYYIWMFDGVLGWIITLCSFFSAIIIAIATD